jgi:DNA-binding SARP family transcriptional activator
MRIRVLGPLEVNGETGWRTLTAAKWRSLLACLVIARSKPVTTDELIDQIWPQGAPRGALNQLHGYVMRVRRALGDPDASFLQTAPPGYRLIVEPDDVDAEQFERLTEQGRSAVREGQADKALQLLTEALELWRGSAFADVPATLAVEAAASRLEQLRWSAREARTDARLMLGHHQDIVIELEVLTAAEPFRERVWAQLMLALYRSGRQVDALAGYQRLQRLLDEELGLEPGRPVQALHQQILRADPDLDLREPAQRATVNRPVPRQLPAGIADFTGRTSQLNDLDGLHAEGGSRPAAVRLTAIVGVGGIGKTSLAVHWAHRVAGSFPDGQLFADLRGYATTPPRSPMDVLGQFLRALGVPPDQVPVETDEAAALYRSLLVDKSVLIVLDNASSPQQVRPLLPGSTSCLVVVTSRDQLTGLVAHDGAGRLSLDPLQPAEARALLADVLGTERVGAEPDSSTELAQLCGHLPLALRIAAANLADQPDRRIADLVSELRQKDRLEVMAIDGDAEVSLADTFDLSYNRLDDAERRLFRMASLVPGPDFSVPAAAALAGIPLEEATRILHRLASGHLVERRLSGRYTFHDLLRLHATHRSAVEDGEVERRTATSRLLGWYLHTASEAVGAELPRVVRLLEAVEPVPPVQSFDDPGTAAAWLDTERACLLAAVQCTADQDLDPPAWYFADVLRSFYFFHRYPSDWLTVARLGVGSARARGHRRGQAAAELSLAYACRYASDYSGAQEYAASAAELCREVDWPAGEGLALNVLAGVHFEQGRYRAGIELQDRVIAIDNAVGDRESLAVHRMNIALAYLSLGQLRSAAEHLERTIELTPESASPQRRSAAQSNLAIIYRWLGRLDLSKKYSEDALALQIATRYDSALFVTYSNLATLHNLLGNQAEALAHTATVARMAGDLKNRRVDGSAFALRAETALHLGRYDDAVTYAREAVDILSANQNRFELIDVFLTQGLGYLGLDDDDAASTSGQSALKISREIEARAFEGKALALLARVDLTRGEVDRAEDLADQALAIHRETGHLPGEASTLSLLADIAAQRGDTDHDTEYRARADELFAEMRASGPTGSAPTTVEDGQDGVVAG